METKMLKDRLMHESTDAALSALQSSNAALDSVLSKSRFHHIGYIVEDLAKSANRFRDFFPEILVDEVHHPEQMVTVSMLRARNGGLCVELVSPDRNNVLMRRQQDATNQSVLPYHICFWVPNFHASMTMLRAAGWLRLTKPFPTHHRGWVASHLYHADAGIVEIMG